VCHILHEDLGTIFNLLMFVDLWVAFVMFYYVMPNDALPSPGVNPLEGPPKCSCGNRDLEGRSRLPAL